jgi:hypothetical protein
MITAGIVAMIVGFFPSVSPLVGALQRPANPMV